MFSLIKINAKAGKAELINTQQTGKFLPTHLVPDFRPIPPIGFELALFFASFKA